MKIALWQTTGIPGDVAANLAALATSARAAAAAGAALLLCPECWLCGYNIEGRITELAEPAAGPSAQAIGRIAQQQGIAIAYGYAERDPESARPYNSVQVLSARGVPLAHYRKTHLFGPAERAAYAAGDRFGVPFDFGGFRLGLLICYDIEFPEPARSLTLAGAEVLLVPTALTHEYRTVPTLLVPARAVENQIFVAYCNHAGVENGLRFLGGSCLVGPDGATIATAGDGETLLIADIERRTQLTAAKIYPYRNDRRPELYGAIGR